MMQTERTAIGQLQNADERTQIYPSRGFKNYPCNKGHFWITKNIKNKIGYIKRYLSDGQKKND